MNRLKGLTVIKIDGAEIGSDCIKFHTKEGRTFKMVHGQECCETVLLEDVCGDIQDLIGSPVIKAEERGRPNIGS